MIAEAVVLHPAEIALDAAMFRQLMPFHDGIGLEHNQALWRPLRDQRFEQILIIGLDPHSSAEEIVLASYLEADRKVFLGNGGIRDVAGWQREVRPNYAPRPVELRRLGADAQREHIRTVNRWLAETLAKADFDAPTTPFTVNPETLIYRTPHLAADLAHQSEDLRVLAFDQPASHFMCMDGSFVYTTDYYRSLANFVGGLDGLSTVLDVGCGSGMLACYLAGSGRYADVLGVDASPERVAGARLNAELNRNPARFEVMSMADLRLPDASVDVSVTSFSLEQSGRHLARCFAEIRRVTRRFMILFEPAIEFFPTLPSLWQVPFSGWATEFHSALAASGLSYAVRPILLYHYYHCGAVLVIDLESREHPALRHRQLFGLDAASWPGGVIIH